MKKNSKRKNKNKTGAFGRSAFYRRKTPIESTYPKIVVSRKIFQKMVDNGIITESGLFIFKP